MSTQTQIPSQTRPAATAAAPAKTHPELQRLLDKEGAISYTPFGAGDEIKLTVKMVQEFIAVKTKSGRTCSERDARRFIMLCQAQRLNPWAGDAYLVGYDAKVAGSNPPQWEPVFSLIVALVAFLKRAETAGDYEGMESGVIIRKEDNSIEERQGDFALFKVDSDGNWESGEDVVGGWAIVYRKGRKPTYRRASVQSVRPNYPTPFWNDLKSPAQICKVAEADALRSTFPSLLGGLYMQEEQYDISRIVVDSKPGNGKFEPVGRGLVETVKPKEEESQSQEEQKAPERETVPTTPTASTGAEPSELESFVLNAGYTFDHLKTWGAESNRLDNADSLAGFGDIPEANAKRLLRIKSVMLDGLAEVKGRAAK